MIKVKVCGLRDRINVRAVAAANPDYMGFIFYPGSKRYVGDSPDKDLFHEIPVKIKKVGVFVNEEPENILELAGKYNLNLVQLHGNESSDQCRTISSSGLRVIKAFGIGSDFDFERLVPYVPVCDYFLFDTQTELFGGTGLRFNWDLLSRYRLDLPFFLSGGIMVEDAGIIRSLSHPLLYAADINSRFEISPGIKDQDKVKSFIQKIKSSKI